MEHNSVTEATDHASGILYASTLTNVGVPKVGFISLAIYEACMCKCLKGHSKYERFSLYNHSTHTQPNFSRQPRLMTNSIHQGPHIILNLQEICKEFKNQRKNCDTYQEKERKKSKRRRKSSNP